MSSNGSDTETREQEVDNALRIIDHLTALQARSILRWLVTNDEEVDRSMLGKISNTVRMTFLDVQYNSNHGINSLLSFATTSSAKFQWRSIQRSQQARAEEEANRTWWDAEPEGETSGALVTLPNTNTEDDARGSLANPFLENMLSTLGAGSFENVQTTHSVRNGQVTVNNFFVNRAPSPQPQAKPEWILCGLCNDWYLEEENVLQGNGKPPCGYHTGQIIDYRNYATVARRTVGVRRTSEAWNCCRRAPNSAGCHPAFHERSEAGETE